MKRAAALSVLAALTLSPREARAQDEDFLNRIPAAQTPNASIAKPSSSGSDGRIYLQDDVIGNIARGALAIPYPLSPSPTWEDLLFLDVRRDWRLSPEVSVTYSGRLNAHLEEGSAFPRKNDFRSDLREIYANVSVGPESFLEVGRINLKSGVALGFNPTDYFKTRAVVEPLSADPSALREDRLGAAMVVGQVLWSHGALVVAAAPKLSRQSALYTSADLPSLDPAFDRTNAHARYLIKASATLAPDFAPEVLFYDEDGVAHFGINLTRGFGEKLISYLEWSGARQTNIAERALLFGRSTGTLPLAAPAVLATNGAKSFQNELGVGVTYTPGRNVSLAVEYDYFQEGFSRADWRTWRQIGESGATPAPARAELWYLRAFAADQQAPLARQTLFLRADWQDALVRHLELTGLVNDDLGDGSGLAQLAVAYDVSRRWTVGGQVSFSFGGRQTDFGSLPGSGSLLVRMSRYF